MRFFGRVPQVSTGGGGTYGVASLNSLIGILRIIAGSNISISEAGNDITISATIPANVESLNALTGNVSLLAGNNISISEAGNGITISATIPANVESLNALTGNVSLLAGNNIGLSVAGNEITITSSAGAGVADLGWYFADDYPSLQAAINACPTGGVLYIPPGNYTISSPLICNKRITIMGAGSKTQIYMNSNDDLLRLGDGSGTQYCVVRDLWLGSAATTASKSCLKMDRISDSLFENIGFIGGNYGFCVRGLRNVFRHCYHITNPGLFFAGTSSCKYLCKIEDGAEYSSNANSFYSCHFRGGAANDYGIYYAETRGEGIIFISNCINEGVGIASIYLSGIVMGFTILVGYGEVTGGKIHIVGCSPGIIINPYSNIDIDNSQSIMILGGYVRDLNVDANSRHPIIIGTKIGDGSFSVSGKQKEISHVTQASSAIIDNAGISNFGENLVDGTMENFSGGLPVGFVAENGAIIAQSGAIKKFGNYSASITLTASRGGIKKVISGTEYITGESISVAMWVYAPTGVTPHIYCRFIGSGLDSFTVIYGSAGAGTWQRIRGTLVLRSDATEVSVGYGVYSGAVGNQVYVDGIELRYGGQVSPVGNGR